MKVLFRSKDFASVEGTGFGFNHRNPTGERWQYRGRVQHAHWQGTFECYWDEAEDGGRTPTELVWIVTGDARLFGLAAALKSVGFAVDVEKE